MSNRSYIDPAGGTVDYVLLFIPNESIYSFINEEDISLIDFSLEKKNNSLFANNSICGFIIDKAGYF